jgi:hypothetical protein
MDNIEEEQTTQWPKEKVQKDKQRSIKEIARANPPVYYPSTATKLIQSPAGL